MRNPFKREPDAEVTITIGKMGSAAEAMIKHSRFVTLVQQYDLNIVGMPMGAEITLRGRPGKVAAFKDRYEAYTALGAL